LLGTTHFRLQGGITCSPDFEGPAFSNSASRTDPSGLPGIPLKGLEISIRFNNSKDEKHYPNLNEISLKFLNKKSLNLPTVAVNGQTGAQMKLSILGAGNRSALGIVSVQTE
jgi:hypothetical protein